MREATMADGLFSIALRALLELGADVDEGELDIQFGTHSTWASRLEGARVKPAAPSSKRALSAVLEPGPGKSEPTMAVCDGDMVVHADASSRAFTGDGRPIGPDGRPAVRGVPLDDWALRRARKASLGPAARVCSAPSSRPSAVSSLPLAPLVPPVSTELLVEDVVDAETRAKGRAARPARKAAKAMERAAQTAAAAMAQRARDDSCCPDDPSSARSGRRCGRGARAKFEAQCSKRAATKLKKTTDQAKWIKQN